MATITISNLHPSGYTFFADSESYMADLSDTELGIQGGISPATPAIAASSEACGILVAAAVCKVVDWLFD